jgi:hypothetical protein
MGLRAQAEQAALARARRDSDALRDRVADARKLLATARRAAAEGHGSISSRPTANRRLTRRTLTRSSA